ncbi:MAG: hypothetical protein BMS9Abin31_0521 [Gammaproteobacteria bacterium]|nr:MAG: hypothetical protein BMS9Abin31_0521 [Gammaproteobacteria bacterium]
MLKGVVNTYRLGVADYRIMYEIYKNDLVVVIIKTGTRNSFY